MVDVETLRSRRGLANLLGAVQELEGDIEAEVLDRLPLDRLQKDFAPPQHPQGRAPPGRPGPTLDARGLRVAFFNQGRHVGRDLARGQNGQNLESRARALHSCPQMALQSSRRALPVPIEKLHEDEIVLRQHGFGFMQTEMLREQPVNDIRQTALADRGRQAAVGDRSQACFVEIALELLEGAHSVGIAGATGRRHAGAHRLDRRPLQRRRRQSERRRLQKQAHLIVLLHVARRERTRRPMRPPVLLDQAVVIEARQNVAHDRPAYLEMRAHRRFRDLIGAERRAGDHAFRHLAVDLLPGRALRVFLNFAGDLKAQRQQLDPDRLDAVRGAADQIAATAEAPDQSVFRQQFERALDRPSADAEQGRDRALQQHNARPEFAGRDVAREFVAHEFVIGLARGGDGGRFEGVGRSGGQGVNLDLIHGKAARRK